MKPCRCVSVVLLALMAPRVQATELDAARPAGRPFDRGDDAAKRPVSSMSLPTRYFTENIGQLGNEAVRLYCSSPRMQVGFAESAILIKVREVAPRQSSSESAPRRPRLPDLDPTRSALLRITFEGARRVAPAGRQEFAHRTHFLRGSDASEWRTDVRSFRQVVYSGLYDDIDLVFLQGSDGMKSEFRLRPGADPGKILVAYEGIDGLEIEDGELVVHTPVGSLRESIPAAYRGEQRRVECSYVLRDATSYGVACEGSDVTQSLTIDPLLYSTYLGGNFGENAYGIAVDTAGNAYVTGETVSTDFPATSGAYDENLGGIKDAFVAKLNASGTGLVYATYLGGSQGDLTRSIAVDSSGNAYLFGDTISSDFPTTPGAYDRTLSTNTEPQDLFVVKLNANGDGLVYGTYIGGSADHGDWGNSIAVDGDGNAYLTGYTGSTDFPTTPGAYDRSHNGGLDAFVVKLNGSGSSLLYSTFLGGGAADAGYSVAVDLHQGSYHAYVGGFTSSGNFPTTAGAYDGSDNGGDDGFVTRLKADGSGLDYSTYLGGMSADYVNGLDVGDDRSVYVTGGTLSSDFPSTFTCGGKRGPFLEVDIFAVRLDDVGGSLVYATLLGGDDTESSEAIAVGPDSHAYLTGWTQSADFPTSAFAVQAEHSGNEDAVVVQLDSSGEIVCSTLLGGGGGDKAYAIAVDANGKAYIAGGTDSGNFPTTAGALDRTHNGGDAFVAALTAPPAADPDGDEDGDGLLDLWEMCGIDENDDGVVDLNLAALGANPGHKDIFVEVDYMADHRLLDDAVSKLVEAFDSAPVSNPDGVDGIALHILLDEELTHQDELEWPDDFDALKDDHVDRPADRNSSNATQIHAARKMVFHYCISAHKLVHSGRRVVGVGELGGNDFAIALGFDIYQQNAAGTHRVGSGEEQAGAFMHELGHNLNLHHGGDDDINFKPNYRSVMSYTWTVPQSHGHWKLDYSREKQATLTENWTLACQRDYPGSFCPYPKLDETVAMDGDAGDIVVHGPPISGSYVVSAADARVDWNQDGDTDDAHSGANLNCLYKNDPDCTCAGTACVNCCDSDSDEVLYGFNDWPNILYNFRSSQDYADYSHGTAPVEAIEPATRLLRGGEPSGRIGRSDDGSNETFASIDYNDDTMEKLVELAIDPEGIEVARLWIYGQPYNYEGEDFEGRADLRIRVNGRGDQVISFEVGQIFNYQTSIYQWVKLDVPPSWLVQGTNSFFIYGEYPVGAWDHNNLRVGVDMATDQDLSSWYGNGLTCGIPETCEGELMIFLEWIPFSTNLQVPGDCNQDGALDLSDAVCTLGVLFTGTPRLFPCGDGTPTDSGNIALIDWQPDGGIDLSDAVAMLQFLFTGGPPHSLAAPGAETTECVVIEGCEANPKCP